jgi:peptide/nickel transport system permease protein
VTAYIARRLALLAPVMFIVATVGFVIIHLAPGDPAMVMLGPDASPERVQELRQQLGLDWPLLVQLGRWYARVLYADFGRSLFEGEPVTRVIAQRLEPTLLLTLLGLGVAVLIGLPAGILAALWPRSAIDRVLMGTALLGVSMPGFWLGLNLILLFSLYLGLLPVSGYVPLRESWSEALRSLVLPALTLGLGGSGLIARMTRAQMLEVLVQDFVRTARAKGLGEWHVIMRHVLRNALVLIVTVVGLSIGTLLAGAITVETVFAVPGVGLLVISSVLRRDFPVIQGVLLFTAAVYVLVNLLVDLIYLYLDPRIKYV